MAAPTYSFSWSAPPECPTEIDVAAEVATLLDSGPAPSARVTAQAVVRHDADGQWHVELTTLRDGEEGARTLVAPSCRSLADATALIVALTIDPARAARIATGNAASPPGATAAPPGGATAPGTSQANGLPPAVPPAVPPAAPAAATATATRAKAESAPSRANAGEQTTARPPAPSTTEPSQARWAIALAATGDVGRLAGPSLGGRLGGAWIGGPWRIEAYGFAWGLPTRSTAPSSSSIGAYVEMFGGGAAACIRVLQTWIEVAPCLGPELGDVHGRGFGVQTPQSQDRAWVAAAASVRAAMRISGPVFMSLEFGAVVPFTQDSFRLDRIASASDPFEPDDKTQKTVYSPDAVQGRAALGVEVRLPP